MNIDKDKLLYLIPVSISSTNNERDVYLFYPQIELIDRLKIVFTEDIKSARRFFRSAGYEGSLGTQLWISLKHEYSVETIMKALSSIDIRSPAGLLSDAGIPAIADPGADVVHLAHQLGIRVIPLPGPSSLFLALASSGLNGQNFSFHGYLPIHERAREKKIKELESIATKTKFTQIFMETPYRNMQLFESIKKICRPDTLLCIAADITGKNEFIKTQTIENWRKEIITLNKIPAVFLINT